MDPFTCFNVSIDKRIKMVTKINTNVILSVLLLVCDASTTNNPMRGNIKTLVETARMNMNDIRSMTKIMFTNITQKCEGTMDMPTQYYLPVPDSGCDRDTYDLVENGYENPASFNYESFLDKLWLTKYGLALTESLAHKGVSEFILKAAMKELWFTKTDYEDTLFNRMFFGKDTVGQKTYERYNSWYTFSFVKENSKSCQIIVHGNSLPVLVSGNCDRNSRTSWFIYPNHLYVDLVIYSLCAWRYQGVIINYEMEICPISMPGTMKLFGIKSYFDHKNSVHFKNGDVDVYDESSCD